MEVARLAARRKIQVRQLLLHSHEQAQVRTRKRIHDDIKSKNTEKVARKCDRTRCIRIMLSQALILSLILAALTQLQVQANSAIPSINNTIGGYELVRHTPNHHHSNDNNQPPKPALPSSGPANPLASATRKFVKLSNNTGSSVRNFNHNLHNINRSSYRNQSALSDLSNGGKSSDKHNAAGHHKRSAFRKNCIGTSNRMSGQHNKTDHYQNLAERYRNCTHIIGNLEITWLEKGADNQQLDLTFLESIREISGYLLIAYVDVEKIRMPNLRIIRGRDTFKLNNGQKEEFAMFLIENELRSLELPNLSEILAGSVGSYNNRNLCHIRTIHWDEILNGNLYKSVFVYNGTTPNCPPCDDSCHGSCWGEGPDMCQNFTKTNCSPQCSQGRCFGPLPRDCCHLFCAGGCFGPKQTDCIACKNFDDDGECIQECPPMSFYDPNTFQWVPNPNGKYAFGADCVKECPEHLLRDNGACVRTCPPNKRNENGVCISCNDGICPKNCQGVEVVHSGNIDQLINCTVIDGSITILDTSFTGYAEVYSNNTIGTRYKPLHPSRLNVFETVREISGYLSIQANHSDFRNLSCFKNLKTIGGRQTTDMFHALSIIKTSLVSLDLKSLKKVSHGRIAIEENKDLCFVDTINWMRANLTRREEVIVRNNADSLRCRKLGLRCHEQCSSVGCWGPGQDECLSCNNHKLSDYCVQDCNSTQTTVGLSYESGHKTCERCHPECKIGCTGKEDQDCLQCKSVKDGPHCKATCPPNKYNNDGVCEMCDKSCSGGCTGPSNRLGKGGCISCDKIVASNMANSSSIGYCIREEDPCPQGYYQEYVSHHTEGLFKSALSRPICRKCHHRCKACTGMGTHVSVCECANFAAGEQCEDKCPIDYYPDVLKRRCHRCSPECNGCFGPTESDCFNCRVYRIYNDTYNPLEPAKLSSGTPSFEEPKQRAKFNCTSKCPPNKPHRISEIFLSDPYCSDKPGSEADNPGVEYLVASPLIIIILMIALAIVFCLTIYKCQMDVQKDKTVKTLMLMSGLNGDEPLNQSNMKPNLARVRSIKDTELRRGNVLGKGFGGVVYQGLWYPDGKDAKDPRPVAIKVLNDTGQSNLNKEFLEEAFIMASVDHPNLVRLLGICATPQELMLVTQLMPLGCLLDYVKDPRNELNSKNLLEWSKQIANGMAYLEGRRMVHRDLALRNVLLRMPGIAMISDFGLAKLLEVDQSEYQSGGGKLPIKWLAPECIRERKFTPKSDVWAFGVTIWELLTFGKKPFEEYDPKEVPNAIENGARLQQPNHVTAEVYKTIYACWFYNPELRPDFKSLANDFVRFAQDPERYLICPPRDREMFGHCEENTFEELRSDMDDGMDDDDSQPRLTMPDLLGSNNHNLINDMPTLKLRHFSETDSAQSQHPATPTLRKSMMQNSNVQQLIEADEFFGNLNAKVTTPAADSNNNNSNFVFDTNGRFNVNQAESCWSVHHTVSTNSLGQKSELPTDGDDYLLPSPCNSNDTKFSKFSKFSASHEGQISKMPPAPQYARDPPHSAGLIGISNDEYFMPRINSYVNSNGSSASHIPHSLV